MNREDLIGELVDLPGNLLAIGFVLVVVGVAVVLSIIGPWWLGLAVIAPPAVMAAVIYNGS